jgi:hypothetical protein
MAQQDYPEFASIYPGLKSLKEVEAERERRLKADEDRLNRMEEKFDRMIELLEDIRREIGKHRPY